MTFVDHYQSIVFIGEVTNFIQLCHVAVHRKDTVGNDDFESGTLSSQKLLFKISHVIVCVTITRSLTQTNPINNRGMVQAI